MRLGFGKPPGKYVSLLNSEFWGCGAFIDEGTHMSIKRNYQLTKTGELVLSKALGEESYNFLFLLSDFCPSHTKFNLYWKRTLMDEIVYQNCSEVDPDLGGEIRFLLSCAFNFIVLCALLETLYEGLNGVLTFTVNG